MLGGLAAGYGRRSVGAPPPLSVRGRQFIPPLMQVDNESAGDGKAEAEFENLQHSPPDLECLQALAFRRQHARRLKIQRASQAVDVRR